ncbi:MAG TPA: sulfotransferase domain-containing protein [Paludibacter sp.]|mgnify:CR=1 FL=1|nr:sulfotransferase domain-containing protein [Paludibacter sp.]
MSIEFGMQENIARNIVLIDGITRCGKSLFSGILPSLDKFEHIRFITLLEHVVPAMSLGAINPSCARSMLRTLMNEIAYDTLLSRNANFRPSDQTGILNYPRPQVYMERLTQEEGLPIIEKLRSCNYHFPFQTHDIMVNLNHFDSLDIDYKMIAMYRHPIDNIYSWFTRGWGERFLDDPQSFTLSISHNGNILPWYCANYAEEWLTLNPMERCVRTALDLLTRSIDQHKKSQHTERILTLTFEDFVQDTDFQMKRICSFLETSTTPWTPAYLAEARCPRILDPKDRTRKLNEFKKGISSELFDKLVEFSKQYEHGLYGLLTKR